MNPPPKFRRCRSSLAALVLLAASSDFASAAPGDLYSTDFLARTVIKYGADATQTVLYTASAALAGAAFDGKGNLFVAEYGAQKITKITPRGEKSTFVSSIKPAALEFDRVGNLVVSDENTNTIVRFAPDGTKTIVAAVSGVAGLAYDPIGVLYVARGSSGVSRIARGINITFATGINAQNLAFNAAGELFVSDSNADAVVRIASNGTKTPFATVNSAAGLLFDASGNLFVSQLADGGSIMLVTPSGVVTTFAQGSGTAPGYLAIEPALHTLLNISTRGQVGTGDHVLIAGFFVGGNGQVDAKVIARALGPSLPIVGALKDPTLTLVNSSGVTVATNDNWKTQEAAVTATGIPPTDDRESAIVTSLAAGSYTAVVRGAGNTTGDALVELYNLQ